MTGEFRKSASQLAIATAAGLFIALAPAQAADLGDDCCEDLEERVAVLEKTTVRKGNRKVSVKLSGWVNEAVLYWDDGVESDIYQINNDFVSRFRFDGSAKISHHLTAGYKQEYYIIGAHSFSVTQVDDNVAPGIGRADDGANGSGDSGFVVGQHFWYLKHKHLGQLSMGRRGSATDELTLIDLGGARAVASLDTANIGGNFRLTSGNTNAVVADSTMRAIFVPIDTNRAEVVRYDSPAIAGFKISAAWGEDDIWDIAVRFAGEFGGIRVAAGVGYYDTSDNLGSSAVNNTPDADEEADNIILGSVSIWDAANTGLYGTGFFHIGEDGEIGGIVAGQKDNADSLRWGIRAGIRQNFLGFGKTNIYADYQVAEVDNRNIVVSNVGFLGDQEGHQWGLGLVQDIDAAAMKLYIQYRHLDFDVRRDADGAKANVNDLQLLHAGGFIKF